MVRQYLRDAAEDTVMTMADGWKGGHLFSTEEQAGTAARHLVMSAVADLEFDNVVSLYRDIDAIEAAEHEDEEIDDDGIESEASQSEY